MKFVTNFSDLEYSVAEFTERSLDGGSYDSGQLEELSNTNEKLKKAFGRLMQYLVDKKIVNTSQDVFCIVGGNDYEFKGVDD